MMLKPSAPRGFPRLDFADHYNQQSSIQLSSLVEPRCIWLGINEPTVQVLADRNAGCTGWVDVDLPQGALVAGRMHLTQEQVRELLPFLQQFAETGDFTPY